MIMDLIHKLMFIDDLMVTASLDEKDRELIFVNNLFCQITGYERSEVIGRSCGFLQGPETDPNHRQAIRRGFDQNEVVFQDILNYKKNGEKFINRLIIFALPVNQKRFLIGIQTVRHDYTSQKPAPKMLGMGDISLTFLSRMSQIRFLISVVSSMTSKLPRFALGEIRVGLDSLSWGF